MKTAVTVIIAMGDLCRIQHYVILMYHTVIGLLVYSLKDTSYQSYDILPFPYLQNYFQNIPKHNQVWGHAYLFLYAFTRTDVTYKFISFTRTCLDMINIPNKFLNKKKSLVTTSYYDSKSFSCHGNIIFQHWLYVISSVFAYYTSDLFVQGGTNFFKYFLFLPL